MNKLIQVSGKIILLGEHFVAYDGKALAGTINLFLNLNLEKSSRNIVFVNNRVFSNPTTMKMVEIVSKHLGIKDSFRITITTQIPLAAGLGSSSAFIVALIHAFNIYYSFNFDLEKINSTAFIVEKSVSSIISGVDNTIVTYGGVILFQKNEFKKITIKQPISFLVVNTGVLSHTHHVLTESRKYINENKNRFNQLVEMSNLLVEQGALALEQNDLQTLGKLLTENQKLLVELGVSCREIDEIVKLAGMHGAYGAKLTGAGRGGCVIILAEEYTGLTKLFSDKGYQTIVVEAGV